MKHETDTQVKEEEEVEDDEEEDGVLSTSDIFLLFRLWVLFFLPTSSSRSSSHLKDISKEERRAKLATYISPHGAICVRVSVSVCECVSGLFNL